MNRTSVLAWVCGASLTALLAGCGGGNSSDATISGNLAGLAANTSVVLTNNGTDSLTVAANGSFKFAKTVASKGSYNVEVATEPAGQTCAVSYGSGVIDYSSDSIANVSVNCTNDAPISVTVTGLPTGKTVSFQLIDVGQLATIPGTVTASTNGTFTFSTASGSTMLLPIGDTYTMQVSQQPVNLPTENHACILSAGQAASGGVVNSTAISVAFTCH
jgi:hypothetical protein